MTAQEFELIVNELTEARNALAKLQLELQTERAKLYLDVVRHPSRYGIDKTTKDPVDAVVNSATNIIELENSIVEAKRRQGECFAKYDLAKYEIDSAKLPEVPASRPPADCVVIDDAR